MSDEEPRDVYSEIDEHVTGKPRRRKKQKEEDEDVVVAETLSKISGREVIKVLDWLHRKYISWMTEAEGGKYATVYKSAREEALQDLTKIYQEIQEQNKAILDEMKNLVESLKGAVSQQQTPPRVSLLEDQRVRALVYILLDTLLGKNPEYQKYKSVVTAILLPEALQQQIEEQQQ